MIDRVAAIRESSRRLVRYLGFMEKTLAETNLHPSAVHALIEIGRGKGVSSVSLSSELQLDKSSVSRLVAKLVQSGLISESRSEADGRAKLLQLTSEGKKTVRRIDRFAAKQVQSALERLADEEQATVVQGLAFYADALSPNSDITKPQPPFTTEIESGYEPGIIGRSVELHARYYSSTSGFGQKFETVVASGMAEFCDRLSSGRNEIWRAMSNGRIVGTVAIDGEDLGDGLAHLRWFIVGDGLRGFGVGRKLIASAVSFCDKNGYPETHLWTFRGLDAARHLYEQFGFELVEERPGSQWGSEVLEQRFVRKNSSG